MCTLTCVCVYGHGRQERLAEHSARLEEHRLRIAAHREVLTALPPEVTLSPKINPVSQRLTRSDSVEDVLLSAGKRYQEKMELKRQEMQQEREKEVTGTPAINKASKTITRDGSVGERLTAAFKEKQAKLKKSVEELQKSKEEEAAGLFKPSITKSAQKLQRPASASDLCLQWGSDVKRKIEVERQKTKEEQEAEIHPPTISERSRKLAARVCVPPLCALDDAGESGGGDTDTAVCLGERSHGILQVRKGRVEDHLLQMRESHERELSTTAELHFLATNPGYPVRACHNGGGVVITNGPRECTNRS